LARIEILLSNDDGLDALGLQVLYTALAALPEVHLTVVAPAGEETGSGFGLNSGFGEVFTVRANAPLNDGVDAGYAVDGKPGDCILWALAELYTSSPPDMVISGINRGQNYGYDILSSGTVGGAGIAWTRGVQRSMAVSLGVSIDAGRLGLERSEFEPGAAFMANFVQSLIHDGVSTKEFAKAMDEQGAFLNINIPPGPIHGAARTVMAPHCHTFDYAKLASDPDHPDVTRYSIGFDMATVDVTSPLAQSFSPETDVGAVAAGLISIATVELPRMLRGGGRCCEDLLPD
jgi:5'/3'-nucleotidase SurE